MRITGEHYLILSLLLTLFFFLLPRPAGADAIGGFLELNYSASTTNNEDETGETTKTKQNNFNQLYNVSLKKTFSPTIFLNAGSTFEKNITNSNVDGEDTQFSVTNIRPSVDLTLKNPVFTLGGRYNRREQMRKGDDLLPVTDVNENYDALFGWRPEGLPSMNLLIERKYLFDKERLRQDTVTDYYLLTLQYIPEYRYLKGLEMRYQPSQNKIQNKLNDTLTTDSVHNGRLTYSDLFFDRRVSLYTSYNITYSEKVITTSSKTGSVESQLFPFSGLSSVDDTPAQDPLNLNSALIDGDLAVSAGVDIGLPPAGGNNKPRNMGLDFVTGPEVNTIYVWVNRDLPVQISNSFLWEIYTSPDNQNWTLYTAIPSAPFGPFQTRFELDFPNVKTRYIKVVTSPLDPAAATGAPGNFSNILVTEIQAFLKTPSAELERKVKDTATNNIYNLDIRTKILDVPSLYYEFSYFLTKVASSFTNYNFSNGISASHTFSKIISGRARVAREDSSLKDEKGLAYLYNTSITADPLDTLSHTLNYSGQTQETSEETTNKHSIYLNNTAELYKGINIKINEGISFQTKDSGEKTTSTSFSFGSGIVPHKKVSLDVFYSKNNTKQTGGVQEAPATSTWLGTLGISYKPFNTLYFSTSVETVTSDDITRTLQNYGANWSPFPDGSLHFSLSYNESLSSDKEKIRQTSPSMRWNISRQTFLDVSSQFLSSKSESQKSDSAVSSAVLRMVF